MVVSIAVAQTSDPGAPQAGITVSGLTGSCNVVVNTSWDNGATWNAVRGGTQLGVLGSIFIRDYFPALNTPTRYQAVVTGGTVATVDNALTITSAVAWLQDPLAPKSAVSFASLPVAGALLLLDGSLVDIDTPQSANYASPMGARLPVGSFGVRQGPTSVPLLLGAVSTQNAAYTAARALFDSSGQLVIRGLPASVPIDPVAHVGASVKNRARKKLGVFNTFDLTFTQVQPANTRIVIPYWTYDSVVALVVAQLGGTPTYNGVLAAQPAGKTYTQWTANPGVAS